VIPPTADSEAAPFRGAPPLRQTEHPETVDTGFLTGEGVTRRIVGAGVDRLMVGAGVERLTVGAGVDFLIVGAGVERRTVGTGVTLTVGARVGCGSTR
jgi:hypothetical protein